MAVNRGQPPEQKNWEAEYADLAARDRRTPLQPPALERLGILTYLLGRDADSIEIHTRAHNLALELGDTRQAARSAVWVAFALIGARELTRAGGWAARARRLLEDGKHDCVECGYILLPQALEQAASGDHAGAQAAFTKAERIGERFVDRDLTSLARMGRGRALLAQGHILDGVTLFDEVMVAVTAGELGPIAAGVVYCSVISACFELLDMRRARAWTDALNEWCQAQPGLVTYRGECLIHRAEILRLQGRWAEALDESQRARDMFAAANRAGRGLAAYGLAELHRLRGEIPDAEDAYRSAAEDGRTPHPGLALLRLAQGQREAARATIERVLAEPSRGRQRANVLAAAVEILLASGDVGAARRASDDLHGLSGTIDSPWLRAMAATAIGAVTLADGEPRQALTPLHDALAIWRDLDSDYEAARVRVLVGRACHALGDDDGARFDWQAAAGVFREAGAAPALAEVEDLLISITKKKEEEEQPKPLPHPSGPALTSRELQVLRLIARGKTNRVIARELDISEKTVARHVSNIFVKLDVATRAAATAYAFTHGMVET